MADLRTEILSRPELSGKVNIGDHVGIMEYFNIVRAGVNSTQTTLNQTDLIKWVASGRYSKIIEGQTTALTPGAKSRCYAFVDVMRNFTDFNIADNQLSGVITLMVNDGILNSGDQNAFNRLLVKSPASYAESLYGRTITLEEVSIALR